MVFLFVFLFKRKKNVSLLSTLKQSFSAQVVLSESLKEFIKNNRCLAHSLELHNQSPY